MPAERGDAPRATVRTDAGTINSHADVMKVGGQGAGRDHVEVFVVAVDPVKRRAERL